MNKTRKKKLKKLAHLNNKKARNFLPVLGGLLDIYDAAVLDEEADLLIAMGVDCINKSELKQRLQKVKTFPMENFDEIYTNVMKKGMLMSYKSEKGEEILELPCIMLGWTEAFFSDGKITQQREKVAIAILEYFNSIKSLINRTGVRSLVNMVYKMMGPNWRVVSFKPTHVNAEVIDMNESLEVPEAKVLTSKTVDNLIEEYGNDNNLAVTHCLCRIAHKIQGDPCRLELPEEAHIWVGKFADHFVNNGLGRRITKDEALAITKEVREKGGVHEVMHYHMNVKDLDLALCSCCWDCCTSLGGYNRCLIPVALNSDYIARISDISKCVGCGTCVKICPVEAISLKEGKARHDDKLCIGCGLCEFHCPEEIVIMEEKKRFVFLPLRKKSMDRTLRWKN